MNFIIPGTAVDGNKACAARNGGVDVDHVAARAAADINGSALRVRRGGTVNGDDIPAVSAIDIDVRVARLRGDTDGIAARAARDADLGLIVILAFAPADVNGIGVPCRCAKNGNIRIFSVDRLIYGHVNTGKHNIEPVDGDVAVHFCGTVRVRVGGVAPVVRNNGVACQDEQFEIGCIHAPEVCFVDCHIPCVCAFGQRDGDALGIRLNLGKRVFNGFLQRGLLHLGRRRFAAGGRRLLDRCVVVNLRFSLRDLLRAFLHDASHRGGSRRSAA